MNRVTIHGRVVKKPELRYTQSEKAVTSFTVAENDPFDRDKAYFFPVVAWGKQAQVCADYLDKGSEVVVSGRLTQRDWTDRDGGKHRETEIMMDAFDFCGSRSDKREEAPRQPAGRPVDVSALEDADDGTLPF